MDLKQMINDQLQKLTSSQYQDALWCKINKQSHKIGKHNAKEAYLSHLPLELHTFLNDCVEKARFMLQNEIQSKLNDKEYKYVITLIYFILNRDTDDTESRYSQLNAATLYLLLNCMEDKCTKFYEKVYTELIDIMSTVKVVDENEPLVISLLNSLRSFLSKVKLEHTELMTTVKVVHRYTYFGRQVFDNYPCEIVLNNVAQLAFVCLKIIVNDNSVKVSEDDIMLTVLIGLMSSLKSKLRTKRGKQEMETHQANVRLFVRQLLTKFCRKERCLISNCIQTICSRNGYDHYEAIALLINELPSEPYQNFILWFRTAMVSNNDSYRLHFQQLVPFLIQGPPDHQVQSKREIVVELLCHSIIKLCADANERTREHAFRNFESISQMESAIVKRVLMRILGHDICLNDVNSNSIMRVLNNGVDLNWRKKNLNKSYIKIICSLMILREDIVSQQTLKWLKSVCIVATPVDLKPCAQNLLAVLKTYASTHVEVVKTVLQIFVVQMSQPVATANYYTKELHDLIFDRIVMLKGNSFTWAITDVLISQEFDSEDVFKKFHALNLLRDGVYKTLIDHNFFEHEAALKLFCVVLQFVEFSNFQCLEKFIMPLLVGKTYPRYAYLIFYAVNQILSKKTVLDCRPAEKETIQRMQAYLLNGFLDKMIPIEAVNYAIELLTTLTKITHVNMNWADAALTEFDNHLKEKLLSIRDGNLKDLTQIERDMVYTSEMLLICDTKLQVSNQNLLKEIMEFSNHTGAYTEYLNTCYEIWTLCVVLYVKMCFRDASLIKECINMLKNIFKTANEYIQLHAIYALYDVCNWQSQEFGPLIPQLFELLESRSVTMRICVIKIITTLINEEQLRLADTQYFQFTGLLSDGDCRVKKLAERYLDYYCGNNERTVAKYFVPSILYYNGYQAPIPGTSQRCRHARSTNNLNRSKIYIFLYRRLSVKVQFNLLEQITKEILKKVCEKTMPFEPKVFEMLEDSFVVILFKVSNDGMPSINDTEKFYEKQIKLVGKELLDKTVQITQKPTYLDFQMIIRNVMCNLLQLLYMKSETNLDAHRNMLQRAFYTVVIATKAFHAEIKHILMDGYPPLERLYKRLDQFYHDKKKYLLTNGSMPFDNMLDFDVDMNFINLTTNQNRKSASNSSLSVNYRAQLPF